MPTALIAGANLRLSLEFVEQYAARAYNVISHCRRPRKVDALPDLSINNDAAPVETGNIMGLGLAITTIIVFIIFGWTSMGVRWLDEGMSQQKITSFAIARVGVVLASLEKK
jgi:hypothetical protein